MRLPAGLKRAFRATFLHPHYVRAVLSLRVVRSGVRLRALNWQRRRRGEIPLPGLRLMTLVAGTPDAEWFLRSGQAAAESITGILARHGLDLRSMAAVLDFGCGVGRVLRHWSDLKGPRIHGSDYNAELVAWCRRHLPYAQVNVNGLHGGLPYADGTLDFAYALSVFTHLTTERQLGWMRELRRVLRPGGHLLVSTHGQRSAERLSAGERSAFDAGQPVVVDGQDEGTNACMAYHPETAGRQQLAAAFEVVDFVPEGARGNPWQDYWLLRKP